MNRIRTPGIDDLEADEHRLQTAVLTPEDELDQSLRPKRLSEFVSNAGNTLYRGISEILDRTMSERRERAGEIGDLRAQTSSQITQVRATTAALRQLREGIWATEDEPTDTGN